MALRIRGRIDIAQIRPSETSGGVNAEKLATTTAAPKTPGNLAAWDAAGNVVDAGGPGSSGSTHAEILTDGNSNIIFANGDVIYVVGVPN
jgi:hypothetical protein